MFRAPLPWGSLFQSVVLQPRSPTRLDVGGCKFGGHRHGKGPQGQEGEAKTHKYGDVTGGTDVDPGAGALASPSWESTKSTEGFWGGKRALPSGVDGSTTLVAPPPRDHTVNRQKGAPEKGGKEGGDVKGMRIAPRPAAAGGDAKKTRGVLKALGAPRRSPRPVQYFPDVAQVELPMWPANKDSVGVACPRSQPRQRRTATTRHCGFNVVNGLSVIATDVSTDPSYTHVFRPPSGAAVLSSSLRAANASSLRNQPNGLGGCPPHPFF